jgi:hypothetical protein
MKIGKRKRVHKKRLVEYIGVAKQPKYTTRREIIT